MSSSVNSSRLNISYPQGDELARISTDNVREELADKRAELSVSLDANSGVVDAYERREREVRGFHILSCPRFSKN